MKLKLKKQNDRYGYVDEDGNWAIEPGFLCAEEFDGGLAIVRPSGLYGYLKEDGSWLIEPTLHYASPFEGEIARVMKGLFWGLMNRRGEWVAEPTLIHAHLKKQPIEYQRHKRQKLIFIIC